LAQARGHGTAGKEKTRLNKVWRASNDKIEGEQELTAKQDRADQRYESGFLLSSFFGEQRKQPNLSPRTYLLCMLAYGVSIRCSLLFLG
jgi:hypothetical protein